MENNAQIIADIAVLKQQYSTLERFIGDQITISTGSIKEHINEVGAKQRLDIQASKKYCEDENITIYGKIEKLKSRMDKVAYGTAGALVVISILAWGISTFASK